MHPVEIVPMVVSNDRAFILIKINNETGEFVLPHGNWSRRSSDISEILLRVMQEAYFVDDARVQRTLFSLGPFDFSLNTHETYNDF